MTTTLPGGCEPFADDGRKAVRSSQDAAPMRLRILALPAVTLGQASQTRYIMVFDRCGDADLTEYLHNADDLAEKCGAQTCLAFAGEIELGGL